MKEIMSSPVIVGKIENSIREIAYIMKQYDIGFLPIAKKNKIVGVITDRDLVIQAVANGTNGNEPIENYITHKVISIESDGELKDILALMSQYQIKRILVTEKGKIIGVIALSDLLSKKIESQAFVNTLHKIDQVSTHMNQHNLQVDSFYL